MFLDVDILKRNDGRGTLLEGKVGEVVSLGRGGLDNAALNLSLGGGRDLSNVGEGVTLDVL